MGTTGLIIILFVLSVIGCTYFIIRIFRATAIANAKRPYNPRPQMLYNYKTQKIQFKEGSQRVAWWHVFWDNL